MPTTIMLPALFFALLASSSSPDTPKPEELFARAAALHQAGDLAAAIPLYEELLRLAPGATQVRSNLGAAYAGLGRLDDAISEYRQALASEEHPAIRQNLALALQKRGRLREAKDEASRALAADPGNRNVSLLLAEIHLLLGEDQTIVDLLQPLAAAHPDDKAIAYVLGTALLNLGKVDDAQRIMDPVFRQESAESHILVGTQHAKRRNWPEALAEFEKARAMNASLPLVNYLVGDALMRGKNDWAGATAAFEAELARNPNHFESNVLLGNLLLEGGRLEKALPLLEHAARLRGDDTAIKYPLGAAYLAAGKLSEAQSLLEAMAAAVPSHQPTQLKLAVLYTKLAAEARARAAALQKEADSRAFEGGREIIDEVLGATGDKPEPAVE